MTTDARSRPEGRDAEVRPRLPSPRSALNQHSVDIVRVYDDLARRPGDVRVFVDRLWPRGRTRTSVDFDLWLKDVAPSTELRTWYGHDPARFATFERRYRRELETGTAAEALATLRAIHERHALVILTATRDVEHSSASVVRRLVVGR